jgi:arginine decarboxylase
MAEQLHYGIEHWGGGYFDVNADGEVQVFLHGPQGRQGISIASVARGLAGRGVSMPVLIRFPDLITDQVAAVNTGFRSAMESCGYQGQFRGVYPVKVNQQEQVIEEITASGAAYHHGLEAGSKAEFLIAMTYVQSSESLIICNGYKDREFITLAMHAGKMGLNVIIVVERPGELETVISCARQLGIRPKIGFRAKLSSTAGGKWAASAGDHSVFGLTAAQMVEAVDRLSQEDMLDSLVLLHYHLGSQIPDIGNIETALEEALSYYESLRNEGAAMGYLDIGGGIAIDYDGNRKSSDSSRNYTIEEFCNRVIGQISARLDARGTPHPVLVSEAGRVLTAFSSVLVFNILDTASLGDEKPLPKPGSGADPALQKLFEIWETVELCSPAAAYRKAAEYRKTLLQLFQKGQLDLRQRGLTDRIYWRILKAAEARLSDAEEAALDFAGMKDILADIYYGNMSIFQSLPDSWAISQLFPVMPLHRLNEAARKRCVIADCTCDCDGRLDAFINRDGVDRSLAVHDLKKQSDYFLGVFLVGAYQETLGDLHNLFGDTHVVSIGLDDQGEMMIYREIPGDKVEDVVAFVEYSPRDMIAVFREKAENAVRSGRITPDERRYIVDLFEKGMEGYTYFEKEGP